MTQYLFSYGTLQLEKVQIESFGRLLRGTKDTLTGFKLGSLQITDEKVLQTSAQTFHPIAMPSNDPDDKIEGMVFEITNEELSQADKYEVDDYKRISATLASGIRAWAYVASKPI
jgi:gamma-glutamylcyclotransferase (GGCT)/AIG2-like uncharacterized protein YtfP